MKTEAEKAVRRHAQRLRRVFPRISPNISDTLLCRRLRAIEARAHAFAERCCNEPVSNEEVRAFDDRALDELDAILGFRLQGIPLFINDDPRGYALKVNDHYMAEHKLDLPTDWGGYGIIAPDVRGES